MLVVSDPYDKSRWDIQSAVVKGDRYQICHDCVGFGKIEGSDLHYAVVCDGCGNGEYVANASLISVIRSCFLVATMEDAEMTTEEDFSVIAAWICDEVSMTLKDKIDQTESEWHHWATTWMLVIWNSSKVFVSSVGDSIALIKNNGQWQQLISLGREFGASLTEHIPIDTETRMRTSYWEGSFEEIILSTDGMEPVIWKNGDKKMSQEVCNSMSFLRNKEQNHESVTNIIGEHRVCDGNRAYIEFLYSSSVRWFSNDDKAVIVIKHNP